VGMWACVRVGMRRSEMSFKLHLCKGASKYDSQPRRSGSPL
jgi:hypothetical protein